MKHKSVKGTISDDSISRQGIVYVALDYEDFMDSFQKGDVLSVDFLGKCIEVPFVGAYSNVDAGRPVMIENGKEGVLAINMGNFAETYGIGTPKERKNSASGWTLCNGCHTIDITISLKEKKGYLEEYLVRNIYYTDDIDDFPHLSKWEFANFRMVCGGAISKGILYRSASPINPIRKRNIYCDNAAREAHVTHFIDLGDYPGEPQRLGGFPGSYLSGQCCFAAGITMDVASPENRSRIAEVFRYIGQNKGVYDIFCLEGKDRTGFAVAVIQSLMGATAEEIKEDYMRSYYNYYGVKKGDRRYEAIFDGNLRKTLNSTFDADFYIAELADEAEKYLKNLGLSGEEISRIRTNLSAPAENILRIG